MHGMQRGSKNIFHSVIFSLSQTINVPVVLICFKPFYCIAILAFHCIIAIYLHNCNFLKDIEMKELDKIINKNRDALVAADGIVVIDRNMKIIVFNEAATRITGFSEEETNGKDCSILFPGNEESRNIINRSCSDGVSYTNLSVSVKLKNGEIREVISSVIPVLSGLKVLSVVFVFRDTKEMLLMAREIQEKTLELSEQKNRLDAIFNSSIEGTFTIDNDWIITAFNKSAEKITGYRADEAIGRHCWEIFRHEKCRNGCHMETTMNKGKPALGVEIDIFSKNGDKIPVRINSAIMRNSANRKTGAVETFIDLSEVRKLSAELSGKYSFRNLAGNGKNSSLLKHQFESVSATSSTVLITGESGTGKELAARAIHHSGRQSDGPFIAINCSAFAESLIESELFGHEEGAFTGAIKSKKGRFEMAEGGTLFLDEIGDLSLILQTKLLRVIENREFERVGGTKSIKLNARIITATNKDLKEEIKAGRFREDFYYRINVFNIHLPPLRERKEDIPQLVNHFINKFNREMAKNIRNCSPEMMDLLHKYHWPGNIRELENVIEHAFILSSGTTLNAGDLPQKLHSDPYFNGQRSLISNKGAEEAEKERILYYLDLNGWNRGKTARVIGVNPSTLWRKMKKHGIL